MFFSAMEIVGKIFQLVHFSRKAAVNPAFPSRRGLAFRMEAMI